MLLDQSITIPRKLKNSKLQNLDSAHQGTTTMHARASKTIYWPKINNHIKNVHATSQRCSYDAPSQPKETLIFSQHPELPI